MFSLPKYHVFGYRVNETSYLCIYIPMNAYVCRYNIMQRVHNKILVFAIIAKRMDFLKISQLNIEYLTLENGVCIESWKHCNRHDSGIIYIAN